MPQSPVDICNIALAMLGEEPIRNFSDNNVRARMCDRFYVAERDRLLGAFDWAFARKLEKLQELVADSTIVPSGFYRYQLPADCKVARDVHPPGSRQKWRVVGDTVLAMLNPAYLYFTVLVEDTSKFSDGFIDLLSTGLAVKMCMPITHDPKLRRELKNDFREAEMNAHEDDANIGSEYLSYDNDPDNDTFVNANATAAASSGAI